MAERDHAACTSGGEPCPDHDDAGRAAGSRSSPSAGSSSSFCLFTATMMWYVLGILALCKTRQDTSCYTPIVDDMRGKLSVYSQ